MDADDSGSRYGFRIRCAQGCVHSGKSLQKKSGRLPCSEQWWPFSWCWAAQGFSDPKRGPRMDPFRHLSGWNCDWRTQVAVTVPSWKVAIARLAADTSNCGKTGWQWNHWKFVKLRLKCWSVEVWCFFWRFQIKSLEIKSLLKLAGDWYPRLFISLLA